MTDPTPAAIPPRADRRRVVAWTAIALLWLLPLGAMQITESVAWSAADFAVFAVLLIGAGLGFELAVRRSVHPAYRGGAALALVAAVLLIGATGAVGIVGGADNPANLMFGGVIAVGVVGAVLGRLRAPGLSRTLLVMACAQVAAGVVALAGGQGEGGARWPWDVVFATLFFGGLWGLWRGLLCTQ